MGIALKQKLIFIQTKWWYFANDWRIENSDFMCSIVELCIRNDLVDHLFIHFTVYVSDCLWDNYIIGIWPAHTSLRRAAKVPGIQWSECKFSSSKLHLDNGSVSHAQRMRRNIYKSPPTLRWSQCEKPLSKIRIKKCIEENAVILWLPSILLSVPVQCAYDHRLIKHSKKKFIRRAIIHSNINAPNPLFMNNSFNFRFP